ncbi:MAG TPA: hypothetical protein PLF68_12540 [Nitrospira sp.]|nr:hypothetical protein [Nitrospira sp.]
MMIFDDGSRLNEKLGDMNYLGTSFLSMSAPSKPDAYEKAMQNCATSTSGSTPAASTQSTGTRLTMTQALEQAWPALTPSRVAAVYKTPDGLYEAIQAKTSAAGVAASRAEYDAWIASHC